MIRGIGIDTIQLERIARVHGEYGEKFLSRILTPVEREYVKRWADPVPRIAGRFAAKEAAMKALGTGRSQGVIWRDIEVVRRQGPPQLQFHGTAAQRFAALGATRALLTLTHADTLALAHVIFVAEP